MEEYKSLGIAGGTIGSIIAIIVLVKKVLLKDKKINCICKSNEQECFYGIRLKSGQVNAANSGHVSNTSATVSGSQGAAVVAVAAHGSDSSFEHEVALV